MLTLFPLLYITAAGFLISSLDAHNNNNFEICFYHQAFKQEKATIKTLESIRKHYPSSSYFLTSDNGSNFSYVAKKYRLSYTHYTTKSSGGTPTPMDFVMDIEFVDRFRKAAHECMSPWIMMVEDDIVCHHASTIIPKFDGNGLRSNNIPLDKSFFEAVANATGSFPHLQPGFQYGLCGGAIYRTAVMRNLKITERELEEWSKYDKRIAIASDILFTTILLMNKYTVGIWDDLEQSGMRNKAAFEHSVKNWYNVPLNDEEKALFQSNNQ